MAPKSGRQRLSTHETRTLLIDAGCELLLGFGVHGGMGVISFSDAIERARVPRTSAYRAFTDDDLEPQDAFRVAVMLTAIERMTVDTSYVAPVLAELTGFDNSPAGRAAELRELIRRWSQAALTSNLANNELRALDALQSIASLSSDPDEVMLTALRGLQAKGNEAFLPLYRAIMVSYGLRFREDFDLELLTSMIAAAGRAATVEWQLDLGSRRTMRPTGPGGAEQPWTLGGILVEGIARVTVEPDPDASVVSADISSWDMPGT